MSWQRCFTGTAALLLAVQLLLLFYLNKGLRNFVAKDVLHLVHGGHSRKHSRPVDDADSFAITSHEALLPSATDPREALLLSSKGGEKIHDSVVIENPGEKWRLLEEEVEEKELEESVELPPPPPRGRVAMLVPFVGPSLPAYFDTFAALAATNVGLVDWIIFCTPELAARSMPPNFITVPLSHAEMALMLSGIVDDPMAEGALPPSGVSNTRKAVARWMEKLLSKEPYFMVEFKPALGWLFRDQLAHYSHWGYGDLDILFGDLGAGWFEREELDSFDLFTYSFGDQNRAYLRGQLTVHRNEHHINNVWRKCPHLTSYDKRVEAWGKGERFSWQSAEGCYSRAVASDRSLNIKYAVKVFSDVGNHASPVRVLVTAAGDVLRCSIASLRRAVNNTDLLFGDGHDPPSRAAAAAALKRGDAEWGAGQKAGAAAAVAAAGMAAAAGRGLAGGKASVNLDATRLGPPVQAATSKMQRLLPSRDMCEKWVPKQYQTCLADVNGQSNVYLHNGQFFKQDYMSLWKSGTPAEAGYAATRWPIMAGTPDGDVSPGAFFHFQEFKNKFRYWNSRPFVVPAHVGIVATMGGLVPVPSSHWTVGAALAYPAARDAWTPQYCLHWEAVASKRGGEKATCRAYVSAAVLRPLAAAAPVAAVAAGVAGKGGDDESGGSREKDAAAEVWEPTSQWRAAAEAGFYDGSGGTARRRAQPASWWNGELVRGLGGGPGGRGGARNSAAGQAAPADLAPAVTLGIVGGATDFAGMLATAATWRGPAMLLVHAGEDEMIVVQRLAAAAAFLAEGSASVAILPRESAPATAVAAGPPLKVMQNMVADACRTRYLMLLSAPRTLGAGAHAHIMRALAAATVAPPTEPTAAAGEDAAGSGCGAHASRWPPVLIVPEWQIGGGPNAAAAAAVPTAAAVSPLDPALTARQLAELAAKKSASPLLSAWRPAGQENLTGAATAASAAAVGAGDALAAAWMAASSDGASAGDSAVGARCEMIPVEMAEQPAANEAEPVLVVDLWSPVALFARRTEEFVGSCCHDTTYGQIFAAAGHPFFLVAGAFVTSAANEAIVAVAATGGGDGGCFLPEKVLKDTTDLHALYTAAVSEVYMTSRGASDSGTVSGTGDSGGGDGGSDGNGDRSAAAADAAAKALKTASVRTSLRTGRKTVARG